jgi:hypothetical protein
MDNSNFITPFFYLNFSHFNLLLRNHWANLDQTLLEWSLDGRLPTKMAAKLKIEKRGDEI